MRYSADILNWAPSRLLTAVTASVAMAAPLAQAQESAPAAVQQATQSSAQSSTKETTLKPVIVQDQKVSEKPEPQGYKPGVTRIGKQATETKNIPQSITIVPESLILDQGVDSFQDALRNVAGLTFNAGEGGRIGDNINLRGYAAYGDIYLDGMRDIAQYNREVFNLESIEVLRGSASMLFGRGSTGGVINQVSKFPLEYDQNKAAITIGSHDYKRATADLNKTVGDTAAVRINAMMTDAGSEREGVDTKRYGFAPSFRWGIGTPDEFEVGYYHLNYDDTPDYGFGWSGGRPVDAARDKFFGLSATDYQRDSADIVTGKYTHRFSDRSELRTVLRAGQYKRDLWATTARPASSPVTDATTVTRGNQTRGGEDQHFFSQTDYSTRFQALGMKHEFLTGFELTREESERWGYTLTRPNGTAFTNASPLKPNTTFGNPNVDATPAAYVRTKSNPTTFTSDSAAIYAQDMIEFVPHWKLLLGTRLDYFKGDYERATGGPLSRTDVMPSYRTGLLYQPTDESTYYLSYGTSFNTSGDLYQYDDQSANTAPEKTRNIEAGAKWELFEGNASVRTSVFRSQKYNERNTDTESASPTNYLLSGKRHTDGVELELAGRITPTLDVFFNYARMWSKIDRTTNAAQLGQDAANTPAHSGSIWASWRFLPQWKLGGGLTGQSKRNPSHGSSNWAPGYVRYDAMLGYEGRGWNAQLNVENLLDKTYWAAVYNGHVIPGAGRTITLKTELSF